MKTTESTRRTQVVYGAPYEFTHASTGKRVVYVDEIHNVYEGNHCVDSYKYANIPFATRHEAHAFVLANGGKEAPAPQLASAAAPIGAGNPLAGQPATVTGYRIEARTHGGGHVLTWLHADGLPRIGDKSIRFTNQGGAVVWQTQIHTGEFHNIGPDESAALETAFCEVSNTRHQQLLVWQARQDERRRCQLPADGSAAAAQIESRSIGAGNPLALLRERTEAAIARGEPVIVEQPTAAALASRPVSVAATQQLTRIEKSGFRKGEYVGYCHGAQRIRKGGSGWETYTLGSSAGTFVYLTASTLQKLNVMLEQAAQ